MSTNINITVGGNSLVDQAKAQQQAARNAKLLKDNQARVEEQAKAQRDAALAAQNLNPDGTLKFGAPPQPAASRDEPAANRQESTQGWGSFWTVGRAQLTAIRQVYNPSPFPGSSTLQSFYSAGKVYVASGDRSTYALLNDNESSIEDTPVSGGFYRVYPIRGDRAIVVFRSQFTGTTDGMVVVSRTGARRLPYTQIPDYFRQRVIGNVPTAYLHWRQMGWSYASSGTNNLSGSIYSGIGTWNAAAPGAGVIPWSVFWASAPPSNGVSLGLSTLALRVHGPGPHKLIDWGITIFNQTDTSAYPSTATYSTYAPEYWGMSKKPLRLDSTTAWGSPQDFKIRTYAGIAKMLDTSHVFYEVDNLGAEQPYGVQTLNDPAWKSIYAAFLQEAPSNYNPSILANTNWKSSSSSRKTLGAYVPTAAYPEAQTTTPQDLTSVVGNPSNVSVETGIAWNTDGDFVYGTFTGTYTFADTSGFNRPPTVVVQESNFNFPTTVGLQQHVFCDWGEDWSARFLEYGLTEADLTP
jgi:hypothetical protein